MKEYAQEAENLGYILTEDELKALGEVDDAYQRMKMTVDTVKKQLAAELAPTVTEVMTTFTKMVETAGKALIDSGIIDGVKELLVSLTMLLEPLLNALSISDTVPERLKPVTNVLYEIADLFARISDTASFFVGLFKTGSIFGMKEGFQQMKTAMGFGYGSGNPNNQQELRMRHEGTWDQYANYYGIGYNATGNDNWRGGLTWVGESGAELVNLPRGSQIVNAQDASSFGDTFYITIDAANVREFNDIVNMARSARVRSRMRG